MDYKGKLYGKIWNKYFDTGHTAEDWDNLMLKVKKLEAENKILNFMIDNGVNEDEMYNSNDITQDK